MQYRRIRISKDVYSGQQGNTRVSQAFSAGSQCDLAATRVVLLSMRSEASTSGGSKLHSSTTFDCGSRCRRANAQSKITVCNPESLCCSMRLTLSVKDRIIGGAGVIFKHTVDMAKKSQIEARAGSHWPTAHLSSTVLFCPSTPDNSDLAAALEKIRAHPSFVPPFSHSHFFHIL